jgi:hypothetical protein
MVWLRHSLRHVHRTIYDCVVTGMTSLGWAGPTTPFSADPVQFLSEFPKEFNLAKAILEPNKLVVTYGIEFPATWLELGGVLAEQRIPFFVDIYGETEGITLALATDVRDLLMGRFPVSSRRIPVKDYTSTTPTAVDGWMIEFMDLERIPVQGRPEGATVRFNAEVTFPDVYGE